MKRLMTQAHVKEDSSYSEELTALARSAEPVARPKALYRVVYIDARDGDRVVIAGQPFTSRVLRVNLEKAHRIFAFLATCGAELDGWSASLTDSLQQFWADTVKRLALDDARAALQKYIKERYQPGKTAVMLPGSLTDWPIEEQRALFDLLGDSAAAIGVVLRESMLMNPVMSISGIAFPTQESFESCMLCPRERCPGRRAPYDVNLYDKKYARQS